MRDRYDEIRARGAEVVAVGTGDMRYATSFVSRENIPFPVLVDDDALAARVASVRRIPFLQLLFDPRSWPGAARAHRGGHRVGAGGRRVTQLGATFVIGPRGIVRYEHVDRHTADHAPLEAVLGALVTQTPVDPA